MTDAKPDITFAEAGAVTVRLEADLLAALDTYVVDRGETRSRPDAVQAILRDWLTEHRYLGSSQGA